MHTKRCASAPDPACDSSGGTRRRARCRQDRHDSAVCMCGDSVKRCHLHSCCNQLHWGVCACAMGVLVKCHACWSCRRGAARVGSAGKHGHVVPPLRRFPHAGPGCASSMAAALGAHGPRTRATVPSQNLDSTLAYAMRLVRPFAESHAAFMPRCSHLSDGSRGPWTLQWGLFQNFGPSGLSLDPHTASMARDARLGPFVAPALAPLQRITSRDDARDTGQIRGPEFHPNLGCLGSELRTATTKAMW